MEIQPSDSPKVIVEASAIPAAPFPIPGATEGGVRAQLLNVDANSGLVTTIIHIAPGARIPAHYHKNGAEAHYVLEGDFIEDGVTHGPGAFFDPSRECDSWPPRLRETAAGY